MTDIGDFDSWYRSEHKNVLAVVTMLCGQDFARAEDATNDAFVKALERWPSVREMESPGGWVTRVAVNKARRSFRLRSRRIRQQNANGIAVEDRHLDSELWLSLIHISEPTRPY